MTQDFRKDVKGVQLSPTGQCKERPLMASLLNLNQRHRTNSKTSLKNYYKTSLNNCIIKKIALVVKTNAIIWQNETALQRRLFKFYNDFVEFHMLCGFSDFCSYIGWVDLLTFMALQRKRIGLGEKVTARPSVNHSQQQHCFCFWPAFLMLPLMCSIQ